VDQLKNLTKKSSWGIRFTPLLLPNKIGKCLHNKHETHGGWIKSQSVDILSSLMDFKGKANIMEEQTGYPMNTKKETKTSK